MYNYHKTHHKSSYICECENRSLLRKRSPEGQKSVLTELDRASPVNLPKRLTASAEGSGFRVPGSSEKNDDRGQVHPDEQANDCSQASVHDAVRNSLDVETKKNVSQPPQQGSDYGSRDNFAQTGFMGTRNMIDHDQGGKREHKCRYRKKDRPQSVERMRLAKPVGDPVAQGTPEDAEDGGDQ